LDFENVAHLRKRQATELVTLGSTNAKYSSGGLVDIEYFVQAQQIMVGFSDTRVRVANTLEAIDRLRENGHFSSGFAENVGDAYRFLRRLIDALRVVRGNAKDLDIPTADSREFAYLARRLQFESSAELLAEVNSKMAFASTLWSLVDLT
jgi:glutamate-ammonia-ligase adenylyltransferase